MSQDVEQDTEGLVCNGTIVDGEATQSAVSVTQVQYPTVGDVLSIFPTHTQLPQTWFPEQKSNYCQISPSPLFKQQFSHLKQARLMSDMSVSLKSNFSIELNPNFNAKAV